MEVPSDFIGPLQVFDPDLNVVWHPHRQEFALERRIKHSERAKMAELKKVTHRVANRKIRDGMEIDQTRRALQRRYRAQSIVDALNRGCWPLLYFRKCDPQTLRELQRELKLADTWAAAEHESRDPVRDAAGAANKIGLADEYEEEFQRDYRWQRLRRDIRDRLREFYSANLSRRRGSRISNPGIPGRVANYGGNSSFA